MTLLIGVGVDFVGGGGGGDLFNGGLEAVLGVSDVADDTEGTVGVDKGIFSPNYTILLTVLYPTLVVSRRGRHHLVRPLVRRLSVLKETPYD